LVNTSFPFYNGYYPFELARKKMRKRGQIQTAEQASEMLDHRAFQRAAFTKFMELPEELSRRFPANTIVIRPHPSEQLEPWKAKVGKLPNVEVIREGNVAEWILASEICIQHNCTTGVEAYCLGKTAIAYRPVCDPRFDLLLPNALSAEAFDLEQLVGLVGAALNGEDISSAKDARVRAGIARRFMANIEGKRACERILDALDSVDLPEEPLTFCASPLHDFSISVRRKIRILKNNVVERSVTAARIRHSAHALDGVNKIELLEVLKAAQKVTGRFGDVKITELEKEILCVY
jgi:hypothetical protein